MTGAGGQGLNSAGPAMKIEKLQLTPAYQALSVDLRQRIVAGEIQPGEPLPTEADLAQSYGVHRSTVREGLRHLEQDGLLKRAGKKLMVTVPSSDKLAQSAERALRMRQVSSWEPLRETRAWATVRADAPPMCVAFSSGQ